MSKKDFFAPGIKTGNFKDEVEVGRNGNKWNLRAVSQGPSYGLISDHAHQQIKNADSPDAYANAPDKGSTCELPIYTGGERPMAAKTLWLVPSTGEMVPACTRGCHYSFREGTCLHGVPIASDGHCTTNCPECRKPYRSRPSKFKGDAWTCQKYDESKCLPPWRVLQEQHPGLQAVWEKKLKEEPWSEQELRGLDQSQVRLLLDDLRVAEKAPVYVDFDGKPIPVKELSNRDKYIQSADQLESLGLDITRMAVKDIKSDELEVPFWVLNKTFIQKFLKWLYPNDTQNSKREFATQLINQYWMMFEEVPVVCMHFKLTKNGLMARLQRIKQKAAEFYNLENYR